MFKLLGIFKRPPAEERRRRPCTAGGACKAHPLRRDEDYARAVENGIAGIRRSAGEVAACLDDVAERLNKKGTV